MSAGARLTAVLVGVLALVAIVVLALNVAGDGGRDPAGSAPPSPSATSVAASAPDRSASATESAPPDEEALAVLTEIEAQVEAIRGLPPADIGPPELITREELRGELQAIFDEEYPQEERDRDNAWLRAFGLLAPDEDVAELQLQLLGDGVLGFYDDIERRMVVVTDSGIDAVAKLTYAHEYTHALQDAAFGLATLETDAVGEDDRGLARTALIEGDANATMFAWAFEHLTEAEVVELREMPVPDTSGVPSWMVAQLEFPYVYGQAWVTHLANEQVMRPDFTEVDAAFAEPPMSTEQIIEFDAWDAREPPIEVELPDIPGAFAAALGGALRGEWQEVDSSPVGQATIQIILEFFGVPGADAAEAAKGWGGDRATVVSGEDGAFALVWRLAWDSPGDATEFAEAYQTVVDALDFEASVRELALTDGHVLVVHASSEEIHAAALNAADPFGDYSGYMESGAEIPSRSRPLASTDRVASVSARRAADSAASSVSTLQSR